MNKVRSFSQSNILVFFFLTNILIISATGTLLQLPGRNPVQVEGKTAIAYVDSVVPPLIAPVYAYTGASPTATGQIVTTKQTNVVAVVSVVPTTSSTPTPPKPSGSSSNNNNNNGHKVAVAIPTSSSVSVTVTPTLPHSTQLPISVSPVAAKSTSSSSPDSDPLETCETPKKRQLGLDYHRHHRRHGLSHLSRHDFFHAND